MYSSLYFGAIKTIGQNVVCRLSNVVMLITLWFFYRRVVQVGDKGVVSSYAPKLIGGDIQVMVYVSMFYKLHNVN